MATLEDVAQLAGVSKSTASRALGRPELVAPETAERVRTAAEALSFFPNRAATALALGRTGLLAIVVPTLENAFFTPIIRGAQRRASESDLHLTISVNGIASDADAAALRRLSMQVDGFLIAAPKGSDAAVAEICALKPSVLIDREIDQIPSVVADTANAFGLLAESFVSQGHTKIAFIGGPDASWQNQQRTRAVREAIYGAAVLGAAAGLGAAGLGAASSNAAFNAVPDAARVRLSEFGPFPPTFAAGFSSVDAVVASGATAVISYSSAISLGLMFGLQARGIRVPDDIVVSADQLLIEALGMRESPSIDVDGELLGSMAMDELIDRIGDAQSVAHGHPRAVAAAARLVGPRERLLVPVRWT